MDIQKILVLFGGVSTEHLISCRSAFNIIGGLREAGFEVSRVGITKSGEWLRFLPDDRVILAEDWAGAAREALRDAGIRYEPSYSPREFITSAAGMVPDVIFPAVHGINCEDGVLQGMLEMSGFPYVGSGVLGSAVCMDKAVSKQLLDGAGIPQCRYVLARRADIDNDAAAEARRILGDLGLPLFLKPSNGGSSVGTLGVHRKEELEEALRTVARYDRTVIVEEFLDARELECAVYGNDRPVTARVGEIVMGSDVEYYDYATKYFSDTASEARIPADIPAELEDRIRETAARAYTVLGARGLSRVDFFLDRRDGKLYLNEINNLPGFTPISLFPKAFEYSGMALPELVTRLCELAAEEQLSKSRLEDIEI